MKNPTDMVRQFAAVHTRVRRKQVAEQLGLSPDALDNAFNNLIKGGWLKRTGHGIYEFVNRPTDTKRSSPISDRLWRAMRANPRFSATDIARMAGTTRNYANKCLRQYLRSGMVRHMGQQTTATGSHETVWMLTKKGKAHRDRPAIDTFKPDPLVVKAVTLNRLICTGAAMNHPSDGETAIKLCRELITAIEETGDEDVHEQ